MTAYFKLTKEDLKLILSSVLIALLLFGGFYTAYAVQQSQTPTLQVTVQAALTFTVSTDNFATLDPSTPVLATSTLNVNTNNNTGWEVRLSGDNQGDISASTTMYLRASSCAAAIDYNTGLIDDTEWIPAGATTSAGNATSITSGDDILAFRVMTASGAVAFRASSWWGTSDVNFNGSQLWAGHASSTAADLRIGDTNVTSGGGDALNTVQYYIDVAGGQTTGCYEGPLTYTAVTN